jgi:hypothetical protein
LDDALEYDPEVRKEMIRFLRRHHLIAQWDPSKLTADFQSGILDFLDAKLQQAREKVQDNSEVDSIVIRDALVTKPMLQAEEKNQQKMVENITMEILRAKLSQLEQFRIKQIELEAEKQQMV